MAVLTQDILLEGIRRDDVFSWLSDPANHRVIVDGAFDGIKENGPGDFDLTLNTQPRSRVMGYRFKAPDDSHGGRRVLVETTGKRTRGDLNYSLRTMKPSTNTLVTVRIDYDPGSVLGGFINNAILSEKLTASLKAMLANLGRAIPRG